MQQGRDESLIRESHLGGLLLDSIHEGGMGGGISGMDISDAAKGIDTAALLREERDR